MDLHFASSCSPFSYLITEHARAVVAIQELQREVNSLLSFRDHVLEAFPHLQLRGEPPPRPSRPTSAPGKSLSEGPSTVVDSGFSTDKASTSMGKSSSSSSGEMSGGARWEPEPGVPLGSTEDELWQLLEVIQKKGTKLRRDLEKAELSERDHVHISDPPTNRVPPRESFLQGEGTKGPHEWYPHSLPGAGPRFDFVPGLEAWGEMERLRQDRLYLMGRLSRAETEAASTHQRLIDLHGQLQSLAGEKRRLEDAFRKVGEDVKGGLRLGRSGVTVSVKTNEDRKSSSVRIGEEVHLPRVLKVPIKDKSTTTKPSRIPQGSPSKSTTLLLPVKEAPSPSVVHGRVVIERERSANRVDGGLSMPASLLKGSRIQVRPNKQRISAILREKDVLSLQKQLLTTVMETEVLRRQMEIATDEWTIKVSEWESEKKILTETQTALTKDKEMLKQQLNSKKDTQDASTWVAPSMQSVGVGTDEEANPSHSVHQGPNVKYDVVVYEESPTRKLPPSPAPRKTPAVEKPPRKTRPLSGGPSESSFGRDSLGRVAKVPLKSLSARAPPSSTYLSSTPSSTPRSSPASSISRGRQDNRATPSGRFVVRRDSNKALSGGGPTSLTNGKGGHSLNHTTPSSKGTANSVTPKVSKPTAPHKTSWRPNRSGNTKPPVRYHPRPQDSNAISSDGGEVSSLTPPNDSLDFYDSISKSFYEPHYIAPGGAALYPWASMLQSSQPWDRDSLEAPSPPQVSRRKVFLPTGAVRLKNVERPTVLPRQNPLEDPVFLKGALDDVNLRVEQILNRIAASQHH